MIITNEASYSRLPDKLILYVIAIEDRRFLVHKGFDIYSILRVFIYRLFGIRGGGASTIGQQLARTITNERERKIERKIREIILSSQLDRLFTKRALVEAYLRIAYFGPNLVGAAAFSGYFFQKELHVLTEDELCIVASTLKYPYSESSYERWNKKVKQRAYYAQKKASQKKWIKNPAAIFQI